MYERKSVSGHTVEWNPEREEEAEKAMMEVVGEIGVEVDSGTASEIRERYQELTDSDGE